jgi:hypothetical protein
VSYPPYFMVLIRRKSTRTKWRLLMIKELSDLGKRLREEQRKQNKLIHNAIKDESMGIDLLIREDGSFDSFGASDFCVAEVQNRQGYGNLTTCRTESSTRSCLG